jgi:VWFA-related protein
MEDMEEVLPERLLRGVIVFCWLTAASMIIRAQAGQAPGPKGQGARIVVNVSRVLVPVVVRDKQGRAIGTLRADDFQIFDDGKLQAITGFSIETRAETTSATNSTPTTAGGAGVANAQRFVVVLFDDLHLSAGDLMRTQNAASKLVRDSQRGMDIGAVITTSGSNTGLTKDSKVLQEAIAKVRPHPFFQSDHMDCPNVDYYLGDLIQNRRDASALEAAMADAMTCAHLDPNTMRNQAQHMAQMAAARAVSRGEEDIRATLGVVREFVKRMTGLRGERMLIVISPGFLTVTPEAISEKSQTIDLAAQSGVMISTLDARGLYTTGGDASSLMSDSARDLSSGSTLQSAATSAYLNENVLAELADGTGGTFVHGSNDIEGGLKRLAVGPEYTYMLEISRENQGADGKYHRLKVKVAHDELLVQARRGYFADKPEKNQN